MSLMGLSLWQPVSLFVIDRWRTLLSTIDYETSVAPITDARSLVMIPLDAHLEHLALGVVQFTRMLVLVDLDG